MPSSDHPDFMDWLRAQGKDWDLPPYWALPDAPLAPEAPYDYQNWE